MRIVPCKVVFRAHDHICCEYVDGRDGTARRIVVSDGAMPTVLAGADGSVVVLHRDEVSGPAWPSTCAA
ncbi:MAG: hypothetical protein ACFBWO_18350 [Paracoccaceae bacterium]